MLRAPAPPTVHRADELRSRPRVGRRNQSARPTCRERPEPLRLRSASVPINTQSKAHPAGSGLVLALHGRNRRSGSGAANAGQERAAERRSSLPRVQCHLSVSPLLTVEARGDPCTYRRWPVPSMPSRTDRTHRHPFNVLFGSKRADLAPLARRGGQHRGEDNVVVTVGRLDSFGDLADADPDEVDALAAPAELDDVVTGGQRGLLVDRSRSNGLPGRDIDDLARVGRTRRSSTRPWVDHNQPSHTFAPALRIGGISLMHKLPNPRSDRGGSPDCDAESE